MNKYGSISVFIYFSHYKYIALQSDCIINYFLDLDFSMLNRIPLTRVHPDLAFK